METVGGIPVKSTAGEEQSKGTADKEQSGHDTIERQECIFVEEELQSVQRTMVEGISEVSGSVTEQGVVEDNEEIAQLSSSDLVCHEDDEIYDSSIIKELEVLTPENCKWKYIDDLAEIILQKLMRGARRKKVNKIRKSQGREAQPNFLWTVTRVGG